MLSAKKNLTFICVQPCIPYYMWQVEVMLHNFIEVGIADKWDIHILFAYNLSEPEWKRNIQTCRRLEKKFAGKAQFFFYQDTREYPISYISSIRPNLLQQHFSAQFLNISSAVFYHDCDIVFTRFPDFLEPLIQDPNWYVSDTKSYIGARYILSKGEDVMNAMCSIVGIERNLVEQREEQSGGAQYLMKGLDFKFFQKMESDCERLFKDITSLNNEKKKADPSHHELQIWCADMWAILWGAWLRGFETRIIPEMSFCWATDSKETWEKKYIFHNAGVVDSAKHTHFYKGDFRFSHPYHHECETYDQTRASYKYFEIVKATGISSCLL